MCVFVFGLLIRVSSFFGTGLCIWWRSLKSSECVFLGTGQNAVLKENVLHVPACTRTYVHVYLYLMAEMCSKTILFRISVRPYVCLCARVGVGVCLCVCM